APPAPLGCDGWIPDTHACVSGRGAWRARPPGKWGRVAGPGSSPPSPAAGAAGVGAAAAVHQRAGSGLALRGSGDERVDRLQRVLHLGRGHRGLRGREAGRYVTPAGTDGESPTIAPISAASAA